MVQIKVIKMSENVYKILSLIFVISSVQTYIQNEPPYAYRQSKSTYLNYELNRLKTNSNPRSSQNDKLSIRNSYQYLNRPQYNYSQHRLRHTHNNYNINNNRFTKMDHILTRITNTDSPASLKVTENPFKKLYASPQVSRITVTEKSILDDYVDIENDQVITEKNDRNHKLADYHRQTTDKTDNSQDSNSNEMKKNAQDDDTDDHDHDDDDDDDDDDEEYEDDGEDWQAEEATEEPTERTLTEYKWRHFGTRSRVEESRKNQGISNTLPGEVHQAVAHARKVVQQGACKTPRIRLIKIQNVYPDAGKAYIPHCTLLHRCSDETGCCKTDSLTCAPKNTERIELYFYTGRPGSYKVEKLEFYNHTECHCIDKTQEVMSGDAAHDEDKYPLRPATGAGVFPGFTGRLEHKTSNVQSIAEPIRRCQCPELFSPQITNKNCRCDCQDGNRDCMRIKRGKEYFSLKDRLCIQRQECGYPACEFGVYIRFSGRCPRKQEKIEALSKISTQ